ncbi:MAG: hypothetical protein EOO53_02075 [Gammaproteobacteria bacterium]|nr:MAG: hypothetical protein EOO53_02075 [Gammaproteobacteria bacterium]
MQDNLKPQLHSSFTYQDFLVGKEKIPLIVIDDFIKDPQALIKFCIDANSFNNADNFYPGLRMPGPELYVHAIHYYLGDLIESAFGIRKNNWLGGRSVYSMVITQPNDMNEQQCIPHVDSFKYDSVACVHYLCDATQGGTSLYRHRKTGFEKIDESRVEYFNKTALEEGVLDIHPKTYMNGSTDFFEQIACVDAKFNRMVIYPTNVLHSGNIAPDFKFDPNPATGRLTLNSFIYGKPAE